MRGVAVVALAFLIDVGPADRSWGELVSSQSDDVDESLYGEPVDFDFTLQVHLSTCTTGTTIDTAFDETCERRTFSVPHVSAGQRIPLPRALDGSCFLRVTTDIDGEAADPRHIQFEPAGCMDVAPSTCTHLVLHEIGTQTSEHVDTDRCEVVIDEAIAREQVRRIVLQRPPP